MEMTWFTFCIDNSAYEVFGSLSRGPRWEKTLPAGKYDQSLGINEVN